MTKADEIKKVSYLLPSKYLEIKFHGENPEFQQYKENNAKVEDKGELIQDAVKNVGRMFKMKTVAVRVSNICQFNILSWNMMIFHSSQIRSVYCKQSGRAGRRV